VATNAHQEVVRLDVAMDEVLVVNIPEEDKGIETSTE